MEERNPIQLSKEIFKPKIFYDLFTKICFNNHIRQEGRLSLEKAYSCLRKQLFSTKFRSFLCLSWNATGVRRKSCWNNFLGLFLQNFNIEKKSGGGRRFLGEKMRNRRTIEEKERERRKNTNQERGGECCRLLLTGVVEEDGE
ncbi:hypothetical protein M9H77_07246 [Catharanthus roseus]|uniref:Uncharacterized protein n=1 Tax=Catharanthus roseus TaxID=4058 RepID=A0ACC0BUI2_CATRO|nr:hypothetical protein M9H77_07246 [Catharanthus roseus]